MNTNLHVLIIEDSEDDMLLVLRELRRSGYNVDFCRADTLETMQAALNRQSWDIVIADYSLPTFSAPQALQLLQRQNLDLPFIIVSGTIGEDTAVAAMKAGAHDYLIKGKLARLVPAVERELREAEERRKRHAAEKALQDSEERWQFALEGNGDGVWDWNIQTNEVLYSRRWKQMLGFEEDEIGNDLREWEKRVHPVDQAYVKAEIQKHLEGKTAQYISEHRVLCKDGTYKWILDRGRVMSRTEDGRPLRLIGTHTDISDRKQAEEELHIQSLALASAVEGIAQLDPQGLYISINAAYADMVGYSVEEMIGKPWQQTVHPDDQARMAVAYRQMLGAGKIEVECRGIRKDGSSFYKQLVMVTAFNKQQHLIGHYCFAKDITERKQTEQKIREQADLLDITTDAICVRDLEHRILYWNKGAERLYGWDAESVFGKSALEILHHAEETLPQLSIIQKTITQEGQWQGELQQFTKDGKTLVLESRWTLMRDEEDNPKSILTVSTDITEKKQLEAQFLRAQRLESLGTLASGIAHDFNNILTPILAAAQLLPLSLDHINPQSQGFLKMIESSTKRGAELVKQILAFARGAEGKRAPLQVRHLLSEVVQVVRQTFPKNIEIDVNIPTSGIWTISADATQLHQVLMNLCVNARDAMPTGGTLSLSVENQVVDAAYSRLNLDAHPGPYVVIMASDTGTGILPELLDRVFDPFFTTKDQGKGTGLGLSTVLGIVKNHGGFIKVYSEVGQGTQFNVYLPAIAETISPPESDPKFLVGNQELILIVDDEPLIQQVTRTALETQNYRTLVAKDGIEALSLYAEHKHEIQLVLMDIMMPLMDGATAIRALQKINPKVRVLATSGLVSHSQLTESPEMTGIKAFLSKPYTAQDLLQSIHDVLKQPDALNPTLP